MAIRLYLDESGDHTSSDPEHIGKRYLGLVSVAFDRPQYDEFAADLEAFKREHLEYDPDDPPVLHREDILHRKGPFAVLRDVDKAKAFSDGLIELISSAKYCIFAVVIDKVEHGRKRYRCLAHPYHYCFHALMERYCGRLGIDNKQGDVMAESRGGSEDHALKSEYREVWQKGTRYLKSIDCQRLLTSKELKLKNKKSNTAGLQLADILAHPLARDVLQNFGISTGKSEYGDRVRKAIQGKYNRQVYSGRIKGYGKVLLD